MGKPLCKAEARALREVQEARYVVMSPTNKRWWKRRCNRARRRHLKRELPHV